jgi:hypothetical protein
VCILEFASSFGTISKLKVCSFRFDAYEGWTLEEVFAVVLKRDLIIADILLSPTATNLGHFVVI